MQLNFQPDLSIFISSSKYKEAFLVCSWAVLIWGFVATAVELANIEKELQASEFMWAIVIKLYESRVYFFATLEVTSFTFYYIITGLHNLVFGHISGEEAQDMHNMALSYFFFKFIMIWGLLDTFFPESLLWSSYFSLLLAGKTFNCLGMTRYKNMVAAGMVDASVVRRQLIAFVINFLTVGILTSLPYFVFYSEVGWHPILLFILDGVQICIQSVIIIFLFFYYLYSIDKPETWPTRDSYSHGVQLIGVCVTEVVHLLNLAYIWSFNFLAFSLLDLVLLQYLLGAYFKLTGAIRSHRDYFNVIHEINNKYPDANPDDITEDCVCAICQENITEGKQLPCSHIFHLKCLQDWMRYRHICPVCRTTLAPAREENANRGDGTWSWSFNFPSFFSLRVQSRTGNGNLDSFEAQVLQLRELFPDEDEQLMRAELRRTGSLVTVADVIMRRGLNQNRENERRGD